MAVGDPHRVLVQTRARAASMLTFFAFVSDNDRGHTDRAFQASSPKTFMGSLRSGPFFARSTRPVLRHRFAQ